MSWVRVLYTAFVGALAFSTSAGAQNQSGWPPPSLPTSAAIRGADFLINLRDTEIQALSEQVSQITGRTLILDPAVRGKVTVISTEPLDADGVWELYQSVLRVHGYAALRAGAVWRIVPQAAVNQGATVDRSGAPRSQDFVTRLLKLRNLQADVAARVLRPLIASYGYLESLPLPNAIVITDTAENVRRVEALARTLDSEKSGTLVSIPLRHAGAKDVGEVVERIMGVGRQGENGSTTRVAVDERSNLILVRGTPEIINEIRAMVESLDQPGDAAAPVTRVFRLKNSDAEAITAVLRGLIGGGQNQVDNPVATSLSSRFGRDGGSIIGAGPTGVGRQPTPIERILGTGQSGMGGLGTRQAGSGIGYGSGGLGYGSDRQDQGIFAARETAAASGAASGFMTPEVAVQPAPSLNAIVVRGAPAAVADIESLIDELDVRRPQVMIEAAIVEITGDVAEQLGIQFGFGDASPPGSFAATSFSNVGVSLRSILSVLGVPASIGIADNGLSGGLRIGNDFGILVQALAQSSKANLLSTPSLTTLDNEPAEIVVGQNVPFRTGSFTTQGNTTAPFTTIEREDVGITMRVVPRVHQGDVIRLEVSQEVSSLVNATVVGAADLITNRRSIQTTVLADNGGTIVLGGLITDDRLSTDSKVPLLGDIPVLGKLFGSERQSRTKQTLFVFLRPTILRDKEALALAARDRYDRLRGMELEPTSRSSLLFEAPTRKLPLEIEGLY